MRQLVKDIMTVNPKVCGIEQPANCALRIMREENVGAVPVVDADQKIIAMITDRDIALHLLDSQKLLNDIPIVEIVTRGHVISMKPDDDVRGAARLMEKYQVRRLPVCDEDTRCVGIISQADIALKEPSQQEIVNLVKGVSVEQQSAT